MKKTSTKKMQVHKTGRGVVYSLVLPIEHVREIEAQRGRKFQQGEPLDVTMIHDASGWIIVTVGAEIHYD